MIDNCRAVRIKSVFFALVAATVFMAVTLITVRAETRSFVSNVGTPAIKIEDVTATLPISVAGDSLARTIYFSNVVEGALTVTVGLSGTAPLTFTSDGAFGLLGMVVTSTDSPWTHSIVYTIAPAPGDYPDVDYTVIDTGGLVASAAISYWRDVTAPYSSIEFPVADYVSGTQLIVTGTASDAGAGVQRVELNTGSWADAVGRGTWRYTWTLPITDGAVFTLNARAIDYLNIFQEPAATRVVTVDNIPPHGLTILTSSLAVNQWKNAEVLGMQWAGIQDGSPLAYQYLVTQTASLSLPQTNGVWTTSATINQPIDEGDWSFYLAARDAAGNWGNTIITGPFRIDRTPPIITTPDIDDRGKSYFHAVGTQLFYTNTLPQIDYFTVSGQATDGPSGLDRVVFSTAFGVTPTSTTPTFFTANYNVSSTSVESGVISATVFDRAGNVAVQTYTYQLDGNAPASEVTTTITTSLINRPVTLTWHTDDDGSGVYSITLLYRRDSGGWLASEHQVLTSTTLSGTFVMTPIESGEYAFASIAEDQVGNRELLPPTPDAIVSVVNYRVYLPAVAKNYPPMPTAQLSLNDGVSYTYRLSATLRLTDTTEGDVITRVRLRLDSGVWGNWQAFVPTLPITLSAGNGLRIIAAQLEGAKGGLAEKSTAIFLVENGDFADNLAAWSKSGELGASPPHDDTAPVSPPKVGLLGDPGFACNNGVPIGYGSLSKDLVMPATMAGQVVKLYFNYRIVSNDRNRDLTDNYDSFDVLINGTRVFRDANTQYFNYCAVAPYNLGWKSHVIVLTAQAGSAVPIDFRVYNRPDHFYNTYVYLDDVRIVIEP